MSRKRMCLAVAVSCLVLGLLLGKTLFGSREPAVALLTESVEYSLVVAGGRTTGFIHNGRAEPIVILAIEGTNGQRADLVAISVPEGLAGRRGIALPQGVGQYAIVLSGNTCNYQLDEQCDTLTVSYYRPFAETVGEWPSIQKLTMVSKKAG